HRCWRSTRLACLRPPICREALFFPGDDDHLRPPADGADRTEQDGGHGRPRVTGLEQQEDVGPEPDLGVGRPAVVGGEVLAFPRGEMDTGHGSAPPKEWGTGVPVGVPAPPTGSGIAHRSRRGPMPVEPWNESGRVWEEDHGLLDAEQLAKCQRADVAEPLRSPVPTRMISNGEYMPAPQTDAQKRVEVRVEELADEASRRLGIS